VFCQGKTNSVAALSSNHFAEASENRHRERSEAISAWILRLPRRCAPRSDEVNVVSMNSFPAQEARHRERSEAISAWILRLPRRCAPRSDEAYGSLLNASFRLKTLSLIS
jgi:hypothetical protein